MGDVSDKALWTLWHVLLGDPIGATPRGSASSAPGTPVVNGASQTGDTLSIDGLPASATGYLKAGDYIQLGSGTGAQLYKVLDDVDSNASGEADLTIWPDLRSSPADDATVVVSNAKGFIPIIYCRVQLDDRHRWILFDGIRSG